MSKILSICVPCLVVSSLCLVVWFVVSPSDSVGESATALPPAVAPADVSDSSEPLVLDEPPAPAQTSDAVQPPVLASSLPVPHAGAAYQPTGSNPYGGIEPVAKDANIQVAAVHAAMQPATRDVRKLTVMAEPTAFNPAAFRENPSAYVNSVEPARAFRPAQPGQGVPVLRSVGGTFFEVKQGSTIDLKVKTLPHQPATFTSLDLGSFANRLTSETVVADSAGIATARFIATTGTLFETDVVVASPVASGQVRYTINVTPAVELDPDLIAEQQRALEASVSE